MQSLMEASNTLLDASERVIGFTRTYVEEPFALKWVEVTTELPTINTMVVLRNDNEWMNTGNNNFHVNWHGAGYLSHFGHDYWTVFGECRGQQIEAATHWAYMYPTNKPQT